MRNVVTEVGMCPCCGTIQGLRADHSLRTHGWNPGKGGQCIGSRRKPAAVDVPLPAPVKLDTTWAASGECRNGWDPELWFAKPESYDAMQAALICGRCPVRAQCLEWAMELGITDGTWGGLDEKERASEKRRRARRAS